ncbi:unnamed protein product [Spirodela intermedia]|uniref:Uncharacterized protein n=1 Tax=Spirodela intermedia TaxID=51605 RepID=A0A7I8IHH2_SPIIN|nr:unnamed protein product [Spirodela intermedia]CAA6656826.1 unnamed protein product [Spirodela intermedia]
MGEQDPPFLTGLISRLRSASKVIHFTSERQFVQLLHEGRPVVVVFTIKGPYTKHLDRVLEEAAAEFYPHAKFVRVCPYSRRVADPNITKYSVKVLPFNYDLSAYGFREFFKRHGMDSPGSN